MTPISGEVQTSLVSEDNTDIDDPREQSAFSSSRALLSYLSGTKTADELVRDCLIRDPESGNLLVQMSWGIFVEIVKELPEHHDKLSALIRPIARLPTTGEDAVQTSIHDFSGFAGEMRDGFHGKQLS